MSQIYTLIWCVLCDCQVAFRSFGFFSEFYFYFPPLIPCSVVCLCLSSHQLLYKEDSPHFHYAFHRHLFSLKPLLYFTFIHIDILYIKWPIALKSKSKAWARLAPKLENISPLTNSRAYLGIFVRL